MHKILLTLAAIVVFNSVIAAQVSFTEKTIVSPLEDTLIHVTKQGVVAHHVLDIYMDCFNYRHQTYSQTGITYTSIALMDENTTLQEMQIWWNSDDSFYYVYSDYTVGMTLVKGDPIVAQAFYLPNQLPHSLSIIRPRR